MITQAAPAGSGPARCLPRHPWALLALILLILGGGAWLRPLALPDEGRYVGVAWEMLCSGDWLTPTLNGLPYFHKPPLFYWITAASLGLLGPGEWAARVAPLLGAAAAMFALLLFAHRWWGERVARAALLVMLSQPLLFVGAQFANLDMLVAGCISVTVLCLAQSALAPGGSDRRALLLAYLFGALGLLAKGLIGVLLPSLIIAIWLLSLGRWRALLRLLWWPGLLLFALIALPWIVLMQRRFDGFLDYFFVVQHFRRFASGGFNNVEPFWFYPAVLALFMAPWVGWLVPAARRSFWSDPVHGALRRLLWIWALVVVGFFSLPQSKLLGYVLPAVPPLSLLLADAATALIDAERPRLRTLWRLGAGLAAVVCVVGLLVVARTQAPDERAMGRVLAAQHQADEPVVFLHAPLFSLPFYARLRAPVQIVDDWDSPELPQHDNWRKEVFDAGQFDRRRAAALLVLPSALPARLCAAPRSWVVGDAGAVGRYRFLDAMPVLARAGSWRLWRVEPNAAESSQTLIWLLPVKRQDLTLCAADE